MIDTDSEDKSKGGERVRAFVEALIVGERAEDTQFGQLLLKTYGEAVHQIGSDSMDSTQFDLVMSLFKGLLEKNLENALQGFQQAHMSKIVFNRLAASFWSLLSIHIATFLLYEPETGEPLILERGGEYTLTLEGTSGFVFRETLSTGNIKSLFSILGNNFVHRYLGAYAANPNLLLLYQSLSTSQANVLKWINDRSVRSLERARQKMCRWIWAEERDQNQKKIKSIRRTITTRQNARHFSQVSNILDTHDEIRSDSVQTGNLSEDIFRLLANQLPRLESHPFVEPEIIFRDSSDPRGTANLEQLLEVQGLCLLTSLPGGGKTTLQNAIAAKHMFNKANVIDIFLKMDDFVSAGFTNVYEFTAEMLLRSAISPLSFENLRILILELERSGRLYWHIENWDQIREADKARYLPHLARLSGVLISTNELESFDSSRKSIGLDKPVKIYRILPFSSQLQSQYIENLALSPDEALHVNSSMRQLPGLASLPAGMAAIVEDQFRSIIDILLGYLDNQQLARKHPRVSLSLKQKRNNCLVDWHNPYVNSVYDIVSALQQFGPARQYDVSRLEEMDLIALGANMDDPNEDSQANLKRAEELFRTGCEGGLLYRTENGKYSFAAPEIGYLMAAISVYAAHSPDFVMKEALDFSTRHPEDQPAQILMAFARWFTKNQNPESPKSMQIRPNEIVSRE